MTFKVGDNVSNGKKPERGIAVIKEIKDDLCTLWYPHFNLTCPGIRIRDLVKETP